MRKKIWLKKSRYLCSIIILSSMLVSCGTKEDLTSNSQDKVNVQVNNIEETDDIKDKANNSAETHSSNENYNSDQFNNTNANDNSDKTHTSGEADMSHLLPDLHAKGTNAYICHDMNETKLKEYQTSLTEQGYDLIFKENVGGLPYYHYANEEYRIQVVDARSVVFISIVEKYNEMITEENILSNTEALEIIRNKAGITSLTNSFSDTTQGNTNENDTTQNNTMQINATQENTKPTPDIVVKYWIKDLYGKTNMLAYRAYSKDGKEVGTYLIYNDIAYEIIDSLEKTCIADVDQDGTYELLSLYDFYSGIYRINLTVYQLRNPIYFSSLTKIPYISYVNCFVPNRGDGELNFFKISDTEVHLVEGHGEEMDYGALMISENGINIEPEHIEYFPYYQWYKDYNYSKNVEEAKTLSPMKEIPEIKVSVGETSISAKGRKVDWNGKTEDKVSFAELMNDVIPMFESPRGLNFIDEICMSFDEGIPTSFSVEDMLINESGAQVFNLPITREVRIGEDGNYYFGLETHIASLLSSSSTTYTSPSYRGFRVVCEFGEDQICEYVFVLSLSPEWDE